MKLSREAVEWMKQNFPKGARVELLKMDDPQAPPAGTLGTVNYVDDIGTIHVMWDNGSSLGIAAGVDDCRRIS